MELFATEGMGHASKICQGLALRAGDTVVSVGGDGTLSEVVTGLMSRPGWEDERAGVALAVLGMLMSLGGDAEAAGPMAGEAAMSQSA